MRMRVTQVTVTDDMGGTDGPRVCIEQTHKAQHAQAILAFLPSVSFPPKMSREEQAVCLVIRAGEKK